MCEIVNNHAGGKDFLYCRTHKVEAHSAKSCQAEDKRVEGLDFINAGIELARIGALNSHSIQAGDRYRIDLGQGLEIVKVILQCNNPIYYLCYRERFGIDTIIFGSHLKPENKVSGIANAP